MVVDSAVPCRPAPARVQRLLAVDWPQQLQQLYSVELAVAVVVVAAVVVWNEMAAVSVVQLLPDHRKPTLDQPLYIKQFNSASYPQREMK